jgi:hypothetical protein
MLDYPIQFMGVNAPKEHQRVIAKLVRSLYRLYDEGKIAYEPLPETMIDAAKTSPTPDVLLYDNVLNRNVIIIEVAADGWKKDFRKVIELVEDYDLEEGFVYNYIQKEWLKYSNKNKVISEKTSFCDAIGQDLNDFVK